MNPTHEAMDSALCLPDLAMKTLVQHVPTDVSWLPGVGLVATALFGLILMVRGARLAPMLASIAIAALGGIGASFAAHQFGTQPWPTIAVGASVGLVVGFVFFRLLLAGLLALTTTVLGLIAFGATTLQPHINSYATRQVTEVSLPPAGGETVAAKWQDFYGYLQANVPNLQGNLLALIGATFVVGALVGFFMPKASRAFWAASTGCVLFLSVAYTFVDGNWPNVTASLGQWVYSIAAFLWAASLIYNFNDLRTPKSKPAPAAAEE